MPNVPVGAYDYTGRLDVHGRVRLQRLLRDAVPVDGHHCVPDTVGGVPRRVPTGGQRPLSAGSPERRVRARSTARSAPSSKVGPACVHPVDQAPTRVSAHSSCRAARWCTHRPAAPARSPSSTRSTSRIGSQVTARRRSPSIGESFGAPGHVDHRLRSATLAPDTVMERTRTITFTRALEFSRRGPADQDRPGRQRQASATNTVTFHVSAASTHRG